MFEGFVRTVIDAGGAEIVAIRDGNGPPVLLMHGNPFTHVSWHAVAPVLAPDFTMVCTDLRGYGDSAKLNSVPDHSNYSFRAMAEDNVNVMAKFGFKRFCAAGHGRGARVLHRMCLDHPGAVERAAIIDIIPTHHLLNHVSRAWGLFSWHWFFMAQPFDLPERLMAADSEFYLRKTLGKGPAGIAFLDPAAYAEYLRCFKNPATIHGMCENYRATFGVNLWMDEADFKTGRKIACPVLLLWGSQGGVGRNHNPVEIWRGYAADIHSDRALPCGHYVPEECALETAAKLAAFFKH
jgi:haloacetate dehalogenase